MTHAAKHFNKHVDDFMARDDSKAYMIELARSLDHSSRSERELNWSEMVKEARGHITAVVPGNRYIENRGTWAHPKLAAFAAR